MKSHNVTICADCGAAGDRCDCDHMGVRAEREMARLREERDALAAALDHPRVWEFLTECHGTQKAHDILAARDARMKREGAAKAEAERDGLAESVAGLRAENARLIRDFNGLNFQAARIRRDAKMEALRGLPVYTQQVYPGCEPFEFTTRRDILAAIAALEKEARDGKQN